MFKILAYLLLAATGLWFFGWIAFAMSANPRDPIAGAFAGATIAGVAGGVGMLMIAGIFLCIHKYLHRDDARPYESSGYSAPLPPPSRERPDSGHVANSMFGR